MRLKQRYLAAVSRGINPGGLIGAAGISAKREPAAMLLMRWTAGDAAASAELLALFVHKLTSKAYRENGRKLSPIDARRIAAAVLTHYSAPNCAACNGKGFQAISGAPSLSARQCDACKGSGSREFDKLFIKGDVWLARWMSAELSRSEVIAERELVIALGVGR